MQWIFATPINCYVPRQYATIQEAIDEATTPCDVINIAAGTYAENLDFLSGQVVSLVGRSVRSTVIDGGGLGSVVNIENGGIIHLEKLTIRNGSAGGIVNDGVLSLTRVKVTKNSNSSSGGGIVNNANGVLEIKRSQIVGNTSSFYCGGIASYGDMTISDNSFISGNISSTPGGIGLWGAHTYEISDSVIANHEADGIVVTVGASLTASHIIVRDNGSSTGSGSGILNRGTLHVESSDFVRNVWGHVNASGGAIYSYGPSLAIVNSNFHKNQSAYGGAIYTGDTEFSCTECRFTYNQGNRIGGAIFSTAGHSNFNIVSSEFVQNSTEGYGGAIYASNPTNENALTISVDNVVFAGNQSGLYGGAIYADSGSMTVWNINDC
jgi:predicted outer membrane repeat protein